MHGDGCHDAELPEAQLGLLLHAERIAVSSGTGPACYPCRNNVGPLVFWLTRNEGLPPNFQVILDR
jgi:hypothetical protein